MSGVWLAHIGGVPLEETLALCGPALLLTASAAATSLRARLQRRPPEAVDEGSPRAYHCPAGQAAAGGGEKTVVRGKSGHRRAWWSGDRPGETRGKVPQKQTA